MAFESRSTVLPSLPAPALLLASAIGVAVCVAGVVLRPAEFWPGYLAAYVFWLGITIGCVGIRLLHELTGGQWGLGIARETAAAAAQVPLLALAFIPLLFGAEGLYGESAHPSWNQHQADYLARGAWTGRAILYFILWWLAAWGYGFERQRRRPDPPHWTVPRMAALGLCMYWVTVTFAAVDWLMALEPRWSSTIYGAIVGMAFAVSGMAAAILFRRLIVRSGVEVPTVTQWHDVGNMLLATVLMWVYFAFSQFLIVWSGDLPQEVVWYQRRNDGVMHWLTLGLILFHFFVPLGLLVCRDVKRNGTRLAQVAVLLLLMRLVELAWFVWPAFSAHRGWMLLFQCAAFAAIGGLWCWMVSRRQARLYELVPVLAPAPRPEAYATPEHGGEAAR